MSPRIPALSDDQTPPASAPTLRAIHTALGVVPNLHRTLAHAPAALRAYTSSVQALATGALDAPLRERIALAVARANRCLYCASAHTVLGAAAGLTDDELQAALEGRSSDPRADAALTFALRLVETRGDVTDAEVAAVRAAGYDDADLLEIAANVAVNVFSNLVNVFVGTDVDFPLVELPESIA